MKERHEVEICTYWSDKIKEEKIKKFLKVHQHVFNSNFNRKDYETKFNENIYGESIITLAYVNGKCVGSRAFWRNDIDGVRSFQPTDSAVFKEYRGMGIHSKMTMSATNELKDKEYIYMYPNDNSLGVYKRLGWNVVDHKKYRLFNFKRDNNDIETIDREYLKWMLSSKNNKLKYIVKNDQYYLVRKRKYNLYLVIAKIDIEFVYNLKKAKYPILLVYANDGKYGRGIVTTTRNVPLEKKVPLHKMDTLF